jgi:hypothetical protein
MPEDRLRKALDAMKNDGGTPAEAEAARRRVRERLAAPAAEMGGAGVVAMPRRAAGGARWKGWAIAAGVALAAMYAGRDRIDALLAPGGPRATVEMVSGQAHTAPEGRLRAGSTLGDGQVVRTAPGARAVLRLADGSSVEVNERTELWVKGAWSGATVHLQRGDVIVQAAKRRRGALRVRTFDTVASVQGTVFAVSAGMAGSAVAVVEGAVRVAHPGGGRLVLAGEVSASNAALSLRPARQAVAWSRDAARYAELLGEFAKIEAQLTAGPAEELRKEARLLRYLPADAILYAAMPNIGGALRRALRISEQRAGESAVFREWWNSPSGRHLRDAADRLQAVAPMLGEEITFMLIAGPRADGHPLPLLLAEVHGGHEEQLDGAIGRLLPDAGAKKNWRVAGGLLAVSDSPERLALAAGRMGGGGGGEFAREIAKRYERGAGWLLGIDAERMRRRAAETGQPVPAPALAFGAGNIRHVFFEQRGGELNEATLAFAGERQGLAGVLATAGGSGAAEYIPAGAILAFSATTREPREVFNGLMEQAARANPEFHGKLREFEAKLGVRLVEDVISAIGADFAAGVERMALPTPEWIAAVEVYRPATLDGAARALVDLFNAELKPERQNQRLSFIQETAGGRSWNGIQSRERGTGLTWTYDRGYLVAGSGRAVVANAIATRNGGVPLVRTAAFRERIPGPVDVHPSGFAWVNPRGALEALGAAASNPALQQLAADREPILVVLNGERERIHLASRTRLTSLILEAMAANAASPANPKGATKPEDVIRSH